MVTSTQPEHVQQLEHQIATVKEQLDTLKTEKEEALLVAQHEKSESLEKYLE